jgi:hypothetical protein
VGDGTVKKIVLIVLIAVICIVLVIIVSACLRPILPGSSVEIVYPAPGATVPTEFSVLAVAAKWSFGVESEPFLFLGAPKSHVGLPPSTVELSVDGVPYARSSGGNHHVFRVTTAPGDHTLGLTTPHGKTEIVVHVTNDPPVRFEPYDRTQHYIEAVDGLKIALYDYLQAAPASVGGDAGSFPFRKIFLAGDGAFILFGTMKDRFLSACEVRYVDLRQRTPTADDIAAGAFVFSWDQETGDRPVKLTAVESGGDRLYLVIVDEEVLTLFSVFPDGSTRRSDFPLSAVAQGLAESVKTTFSADIVTRANRDVLFIGLDTYRMNKPLGHFDLVVQGDIAKAVDLGRKDVDGITPDGRLITLYPASFVGPFDAALMGDTGPISTYFPLPEAGETFSFTGGSVHETDRFYPERPRFEIAPPVPCIGCTKDYVPPHDGIAGDVRFPPDILKVTLGGREGYFQMESVEK